MRSPVACCQRATQRRQKPQSPSNTITGRSSTPASYSTFPPGTHCDLSKSGRGRCCLCYRQMVCRKGWLDMNRNSFIGIVIFIAAAFAHQIAAQNSGGSKVQMVLQEEMFSIPGKEAAIQRAV